jgi:hypothetical protein
MPEDVVFSNEIQPTTAMFIRIKESKTDPFRVGHTITIGGTNTPLCPVLAMKQYLAIGAPKSGPLFVNAVGKPLTKQALALETRNCLLKLGSMPQILWVIVVQNSCCNDSSCSEITFLAY